MLENKAITNATWIIACKLIQVIMGLLISMLSARYLGPANFGIINYAASLVSFVVPLMQLGFKSVLVKEIIERPNIEGETLGTAILLNIISAVACMIGISCVVFFLNRNEIETQIVCILYSFNLLFQAVEMIQYWFYAKLLSKYTSIVSLCAYVIVSLYKIFLLVAKKSIYWFAVSQTLDYAIISVTLLVIYKKIGGQKFCFSCKIAEKLFYNSKWYILSGMMVGIIQQSDRLMLKNMVDENAVGYYSSAVACAGLTGFFFTAIVDSMRPVILEKRRVDLVTFQKSLTDLFSMIFFLSLLQCIVMTIFAKPIILILYGEEYIEAANILKLIVWYITYSYFGTARNVWILAEGKQHVLWKINLIGALLNIILNFILIPTLGTLGAALASLLTQFFLNFVLGFIMKSIRECNKYIIRGINPRYFFNLISESIKNHF